MPALWKKDISSLKANCPTETEMVSSKYRFVYLILGFGCLLYLVYDSIYNYDDITALNILEFSVPALVFLGLAYKTYPPIEKRK